MEYVNETEKFWKHSYRVHLANLDSTGIVVNADSDQEALDYAVDYAEKQGWVGYFVDEADIDRDENENEVNIILAGNHCLALPADEIHIFQLD